MPSSATPSPSSAPESLEVADGDPLAELKRVLTEEGEFLRKLDLAGIEAVAEKKEQLLGALRALSPSAEDLPRVKEVRQLALHNQLLTIHARDVVASIISAAAHGTWQPAAVQPGTWQAGRNGVALPPGVRVSIRG